VTGSDVVFHLAAETDITGERERHELVSVRGTRAAVDAARYAQVPRFVHCRSEAALLAGDPLVDVDETTPLRPEPCPRQGRPRPGLRTHPGIIMMTCDPQL
jgi:nucleoside-diphosphate-sugar epimerase